VAGTPAEIDDDFHRISVTLSEQFVKL
jgi:hypothetical protein